METKKKLSERIGITKEQVFYLLLADVLYAMALNLFYVGNKIAAGGFAGVATVINSFIRSPPRIILVPQMPFVLSDILQAGKSSVRSSD